MSFRSGFKFGYLILAALLVVAVSSCAKPPTAEVEAARSAVAKAAGDADVVVYEADLLRSAQSALARMEDELKAKRYPAAKTFAIEAAATAQRASSEAGGAKARMKTEATELVAGLETALAEAQKTFASAKRLSGLKLDLKAVGDDLDAAAKSVEAAKKSLASGDFKAARDTGAAAKAKIAEIQKSLADAVSATKKKK